jgi:hypothetical protein
MEQSDTPQNMSFGANGVDRGRLLRKFLTRLCLANLCVNGTSSASFYIDFRAVTNRSEIPQNMSLGSNGVGQVHSLKNFGATLFSEPVR